MLYFTLKILREKGSINFTLSHLCFKVKCLKIFMRQKINKNIHIYDLLFNYFYKFSAIYEINYKVFIDFYFFLLFN